MAKYNYKALTEELLKNGSESFSLTYDELKLPSSYKKHNSITKKSRLGQSILKAGFIFENSYQNETITFVKNQEEASNLLKNTQVSPSEIFLNVIFPHAAEYVNAKGNIGHEIINIFGDDDGKYHYYLLPWGLVAKSNIPKVVISICQSSTGLYKVLNKAVIDRPEKYSTESSSTQNLYSKQHKKFKYNDKFLEDYFKFNAGKTKVLSSFLCKGIYEPKEPIYFAFSSFKQKRTQSMIYKLVSNEPGRKGICVNFNNADKELLESIMTNNSLWNKEPIKTFKEYAQSYESNEHFNFFKELGIEKQELQYSNAIRYFLEHYNLTNEFLKNIGCKIRNDDKFYIERENYNIDLLFTNFNLLKKDKNINKEKIVIVENKIKANVTPTDNDKTISEQVDKIFRYVYDIEDDEKLNSKQIAKLERLNALLKIKENIDKMPSQLSKYYIYAVILADQRGWTKEKINKDIDCYFLCPEYSKMLYEVTKNGHLINNTFVGKNDILFLQEKYLLITYKKVLPVFEKCLKSVSDVQKVFLQDFINSMANQAKDRDDSLEQSMIEMFYLRSKN